MEKDLNCSPKISSFKDGERRLGSYRKGYRLERLAMEYMLKNYGAVCVRSAGSRGVCDLVCGNGRQVFAVQVKGGGKRPPKTSWRNLEKFASKFGAKPLLLWKPDYGQFVELGESDAERT